MLTLQSLASLQLLSSICSQKEVLVLLRKCPPFESLSKTLCVKQTKQYKRLERRVAKVLSNIPLPPFLRKQVMSQLLHASQEILKWIHCHTDNPTLKIKVPRHFVWNLNGSIGYKKTAELIVQDESRTIPQRFKMACLYCQKEEIRKLWIKMKSNQQKIFYNPKSPERIKQNHIISYWSYQIQTAPIRWKSEKMFTLAAFDYAVSEGHLEATRFFFELLQGRRRSLLEVYVRKLASKRNYEVYYKFLSTNGVCNLLFYLHNRMNPVDQEDIRQRYPFAFLMSCLSNYRLRDFLDAVGENKRYLTYYHFGLLLKIVFSKHVLRFEGNDYWTIFQELFFVSKTVLRAEPNVGGYTLLALIQQKFLYYPNKKTKFEANREGWDILKFLVHNMLDQKSIQLYKRLFFNYCVGSPAVCRQKWTAISRLLFTFSRMKHTC